MFYYRTNWDGTAPMGELYILFEDVGTAADKTVNPTQIKYTFDQMEQVQFVLRTGSANGTIIEGKTITCQSSDRFWNVTFSNLKLGETYYYNVNRKLKTKSGWDGEENAIIRQFTGNSYTPSFSYNSSTNIINKSSTYNQSHDMNIMAVTAVNDYSPLNRYSREVRTLMFEACMQSTEQNDILGKISNVMSISDDQYDNGNWTMPSIFPSEGILYKWSFWRPPDGVIDIKVIYKNNNYQSELSSAVNSWITDINKLLGGTYFRRNDSSARTDFIFNVIIGTHTELWNYNPDVSSGETQIFYGTWSITRVYTYNWEPAAAEVKLCNELRASMCNPAYFKNIVYEELTECLGCGNDQFRVTDSMFSEIWYIGKNNRLYENNSVLSTDGQVVHLLYQPELVQGMRPRELINLLTPDSSGCISLEQGITLDFLTKGQTYKLKMFCIRRPVTWKKNNDDGLYYWYWLDSDCSYSNITAEQTITMPDNRPDPFSWTYSKTQGGNFNLTAEEWNGLLTNINQVRVYKGLDNYSFTAAVSENSFTAVMYNQARSAIQGISSEFGANIPEVKSGQDITAYIMNIIVSDLNKAQ